MEDARQRVANLQRAPRAEAARAWREWTWAAALNGGSCAVRFIRDSVQPSVKGSVEGGGAPALPVAGQGALDLIMQTWTPLWVNAEHEDEQRPTR
eukprot:6770559-Pyramimonas_sp.AAC.1